MAGLAYRLRPTEEDRRGDPRTRRLMSLFRARLRVLRHTLDETTLAAVEVMPALFHATFPWPQLKTEPPGVEGVRASLRWMKLARRFDLPAPVGIQRDRRLIAALLITPRSDGLDVHVVPTPNLTPGDEQRIATRARAVEILFRRRLLPISITPTGPSAQPYDSASRSRLIATGVLLAGRLPDVFFGPTGPTIDPLASEPWRTAPTPFSRALGLLSLEPWPNGETAELEEMADFAHAVDMPISAFSDPDLFAAARAALRSRTPGLPFATCALASTNPRVRLAAHRLARHFGPALPLPEAHTEPLTADAIVTLGRGLALELARAVRRTSVIEEQRHLRLILSHEVLAGGLPRVVLAPLRAALGRVKKGNEVPPLTETTHRGAVEVRLPQGGVLGRGRDRPQAWVRALTLVSHVLERPWVPASGAATWRRMTTRLTEPIARKSLVIKVTPRPLDGPPYDPLNRGRWRDVAFDKSLVISLRPRGRPSAREVEPHDLPLLVIRETLAGSAIDFAAHDTDAQSVEARLTRLARRVRATVPHGKTLAVELAGFVYSVDQQRMKKVPFECFARRPVKVVLDFEAPDLGAAASQSREVSGVPGQLQCLVWTGDDPIAHVLYLEETGLVFREEVPLVNVEAHVSEAQRLLRAGDACALAVRAADEAVMQALQTTGVPDVALSISGNLPFDLEVELDGERYGGKSKLSWAAAALATTAKWPLGTRGRIVIEHLDITVGRGADERPPSGLERLVARALVLRRLDAHIRALTRT
ncbi:MAG: hypothetical protein JNJ54_07340 [Myxococcaceae bacterium]|nr:hypothetical protein [Myxococcaceae bacterium]